MKSDSVDSWIAIEEKLPQKKQKVWYVQRGKVKFGEFYDYGDLGQFFTPGKLWVPGNGITHWMPFREPVPPDSVLSVNDAARIPQPTYEHLWQAYVAGAKSGQAHTDASEIDINRAADAYCKLFHARNDPEGFEAIGDSK
jgi:hypothetical protein